MDSSSSWYFEDSKRFAGGRGVVSNRSSLVCWALDIFFPRGASLEDRKIVDWKISSVSAIVLLSPEFGLKFGCLIGTEVIARCRNIGSVGPDTGVKGCFVKHI